MAKAIKTIKVKIHNQNRGKEEALNQTVDILNEVLATYIDLTLANSHLLSQKKECVNKKTEVSFTRALTSQELLSEIEKISFATPAHPTPIIDIKALYPSLDTSFRRSCINTAIGMCKSYLSNRENWRGCAKKNKSKNPPSPPEPLNLPTFYKGTYQLELLDIQNQFVRLKVYYQGEWVYINYPVKIGSKQLKILQSGEWTILSPTLVPKKDRGKTSWYLHIPVEKKVNVKKIEEQKKENPNLTTLSIDMGLKHIAVVTVRKNGKIVFVKFFRCEKIEAHRLRHLVKIFLKQKKSGKAVKGERSNRRLWKHIGSMNDAYAHLVSREIIEIAKEYSVSVIIIEHLRKFRNRKGEKKSKKFNRKFTYWLKGKLEFNLRYKALEHGVLVKSVSPAFTSLVCNKCGGFGERFSSNSLFRCFYCSYVANADFNASVNLHQVFWGTFPLPKKRKKRKSEGRERGERREGLALSPCSPASTFKKPARKRKVARSGVCGKLKRKKLISLAIC
jgi:IS605 OrfB family transposase